MENRFLTSGQSSTVVYGGLCEQLLQATDTKGALNDATIHIFAISYDRSASLHEFLIKYKKDLSPLYVFLNQRILYSFNSNETTDEVFLNS